MIKINLVSLPVIFNSFRTLSSTNLPVGLSYKLNKVMKKIQSEFEIFNDMRSKIMDKYAQRDEAGQVKLTAEGGLDIEESMKASYEQELQDFMSLEVEIECDKIPLSALDNSGVVMSPSDLSYIEPFLEFDI